MAPKPKYSIKKSQIESAYKKASGNISQVARLLGIPRTTLNSMTERFKLNADDYRAALIGAPDTEDSVQKQLKSVSQTNTLLRRQLENLQKQMERGDILRKEIFKLKDIDFTPPKWTLEDRSKKKPRSKIPVLFTSDFQWGEVIKPAEVNFINEYNIETAKRRYRDLISATIDLCMNHQVQKEYPGIFYLRGGDTVSGDIHEELKQTNELTSLMQVQSVVKEEASGINKLLEVFPEVIVASVSGNHGRQTVKPMAKSYAVTSYDYLVSLTLEMLFAGNPRVKFFSPVSGDFYFKVFSTRFLLTHGDRIGSSGGEGFVGPAATISRGIKKTRDMYASIGKPVDWVLLGHFHTSMLLPNGMVNGSLPGYSEYAQSFRMDPQPPLQTLFFVDPKYGLEQYRRIILESRITSTVDSSWFMPLALTDKQKDL